MNIESSEHPKLQKWEVYLNEVRDSIFSLDGLPDRNVCLAIVEKFIASELLRRTELEESNLFSEASGRYLTGFSYEKLLTAVNDAVIGDWTKVKHLINLQYNYSASQDNHDLVSTVEGFFYIRLNLIGESIMPHGRPFDMALLD